MSGAVELAGLALGAFPAVIYLLDSFQQGYGFFKAWRSFRREHTEITNKLRQEQVLLKQHIGLMLRYVHDSEFDSQNMEQNLEVTEWHSSVLEERLQERFQDPKDYVVYKEALESINLLLKSMERKLQKFEPQPTKPRALASKGLEEQFNRLRFTLKRKAWNAQVEDLSRKIDRVVKILGGTEDFAEARQPRGLSISQGFKKVRAQAVSLHEAITRGLTCSCKNEHSFKLLLADRTMPTPIDPETGSRPLRVSFPLRQRLWTKPSTVIHQKDAWCTADTTMVAFADSCRQSSPRRDTVDESTIYSDSIFTAPLSTATTILTTGSSMTWVDSSKPKQELNDAARMRSPSTSSSLIKYNIQIKDLCHLLHSYGDETCLGHLSDERGSWHQVHALPSISPTSCNFLRIVSLEAILNRSNPTLDAARDNSLKTSRRERMSLALTLAYALMELHLTPWMPTALRKTDVYFFERQGGVVVSRSPFFVCQVVSTHQDLEKEAASSPDDQDDSNVLLSLGILIMELWFGEAIESKSWWKEFCGPDNKQTKFTNFNAALSWQKDAQSSGGKRLHEITQRCIYGNFGVTERHLSDDQFATAVFEGVVRELQCLVDGFEETRTMSRLDELRL